MLGFEVEGLDSKLGAHAVPRRAAGDKRAYERLETEPGLDKFVADPEGGHTGQPL